MFSIPCGGLTGLRPGFCVLPDKSDSCQTRRCALAELTGARVHLAHVSTRGAIEAVRRAKQRGLPVTCEVAPHHWALTDEAVAGERGSSPTPGSPSGQPAWGGAVREGSVSGLEARADLRMLRQALLNLLRNAAEAIDETRIDRRVVVNSSSEADRAGKLWAVISVRDTGPGIAQSDLQKIFIPFFTTKTQGHGIGLALTHRVITEHGGTLTAANASDGGAIFTIRLPLQLT